MDAANGCVMRCSLRRERTERSLLKDGSGGRETARFVWMAHGFAAWRMRLHARQSPRSVAWMGCARTFHSNTTHISRTHDATWRCLSSQRGRSNTTDGSSTVYQPHEGSFQVPRSRDDPSSLNGYVAFTTIHPSCTLCGGCVPPVPIDDTVHPRSTALLSPNESGLKPTCSPVEPRFERGSVPPPLRDLDRTARRIDRTKEISMGGLDRALEEGRNTCRLGWRLVAATGDAASRTHAAHPQHHERSEGGPRLVRSARKECKRRFYKGGSSCRTRPTFRKGGHMSHTSLRFRMQDAEHQSHRSLHRQRERLFRRRRAGSQVHQPTHLRLQEDAGFLRRARRGDVCDRSSRIRD